MVFLLTDGSCLAATPLVPHCLAVVRRNPTVYARDEDAVR